MNTFQLNVKDIRKQLKSVLKCVNVSSVLPILSCVLVEIGNKKIKFTVSDLETFCIVEYDLDVDFTDNFLLNAKKFSNFISNSISDIITVELNNATIKFILSEFKISFKKDKNETRDSYPKTPSFDNEVPSLTISGIELITKLNRALPFLSKDDLRPAMTGVYFHSEEGQLNICSTDAHRLYFEKVKTVQNNKSKYDFILPNKSSRLLLSSIGKPDVAFYISNNNIKFVSDNVTITSRFVDTKFPQYQSILVKNENSVFLKRSQLYSLICLSVLFSDSSTKQTKVSIDKNSLSFSGGGIDVEETFEYSIPAYNKSNADSILTLAFNSVFVKQIIQLDKKEEFVKIDYSDSPTRAIIINDKYLIMPLMLNN